MLGILYILVCFFTGCMICTIAFPDLTQTKFSYDGKRIDINPYFVLLPAWYVTGTLLVTWVTYFTAYIWRNNQEPLKTANLIVMPLFLILSLIYFRNKKSITGADRGILKQIVEGKNKEKIQLYNQNTRFSWGEILFLILVFVLAALLMWTTFFIKGDGLYVGVSVFSDFAPHIGMIRSFSAGSNFPTMYSHFAGEDIRYHFMFQFMVGNLEYLGLRLDNAFNIPSTISFMTTFMLLYVTAVKISGKKAAGYLTCLLFAFRSSVSLFKFLSQVPKGENIWQALLSNKEFIGTTPNENWGLWNLNVYCNQRHLAFSLTVMLLILLMFLPHIYSRFEVPDRSLKLWFFTKEGWQVKDIKLAAAAGILLGSIAFWNGAVLIAALLVLFLIGISSQRRSELLIMAVIAILMAVLQARFFINDSISPKFYFGFISENPTLFGSAVYLIKLLGLLPFVLFAAFLLNNGVKRYLMAAFSLPIVLAFTLSLTVDITVNHKYIMIAVMLLDILAADLLIRMYEKQDYWFKTGCILITVVLISTGLYDFVTILRKNQPETAVVLNLGDDLTKWIEDNSDSKDIFLTSNYALNQVVLGGAMLFQGWQYYAWSAGYNTIARDEQVKLMYEADAPSELKTLVNQNHIRFIIVDWDNRYSEAYELNEKNIRNTYALVFQEGEGEQTTSVYDTRIPIIN